MHNNVLYRFPEWKAKAVTLSYDDATKTDVKLLSIMKKYGLKGTFNINSGLYSCNQYRLSQLEANNLYLESGMEIAAHGLKHLSADSLSELELVEEFSRDKENLESEYGYPIRGFAYANGIVTDLAVKVLKDCGFAYARTVVSTNDFSIPSGEWLKWNPTCHHTAQNFNELVQLFISENPEQAYSKEPLLFYVWGHSIEFERNNNWQLIENFASSIAMCGDIWHATNLEVCEYVKAYRSLSFSEKCDKVVNNSSIDVYLLVDGKKVLAKAGQVTEF